MSTGFTQRGTEFLVNTYTTLEQRNVSVAGLTGGGYFVTWESKAQDGDSYGIYGQRYDADGIAVGAEVQVNSNTLTGQRTASVTGLDGGGYVVTWTSSHELGGTSSGIYGQRYDASGVVQGGEFHINTYTPGSQLYSNITSLDGGGFLVTWTDLVQDGSSHGIYGQRYDASGVAAGVEFLVNTTTVGIQKQSAATGLVNGGFIITWTAGTQDGDGYGIIGQMYNSSGVAIGGEFQINTEIVDDQEAVSVTALEDGGFVVIWQSDGDQDGDGMGVYGQRYDASGAATGGEFQVNTYVNFDQAVPSVAGLADGGFVVAWSSNLQDGSSYGVYGQRYDANGDPVGGEVHISTTTFSYQSDAVVAGLADGGFVVSWQSPTDGSTWGIFSQQFAAELWGTSGNDTLIDFGGAGWLNGQGGADILKGAGGQDLIFGGSGGDTLIGGSGKDNLQGQGGKDTLKGGKGNDELDGGAKNDRLTGGDGKDKFVFMDGSGKDRITDFEDDLDTIRLDEDLWGGGMTKQQVINMYASVDGGDIVFDFGTDQLRLKGFTDLTELKDDMALI